MIVEAEIIEKPGRFCRVPIIAASPSKSPGKVNHEPWHPATIDFFNTIGAKQPCAKGRL
jgi:hypothetical protein